jgi:predicted Zn-dependent protease
VSSESPNDSLSEAAIRSLTEGGSSEQAVWALSGYVAQGRLRIARTFVLSARRRFTDDVNLEILDGVISYRDGDLARAESVLRGVVTVHPDNMLARLDLGMLLAEQGRAEAKEMLDRVIKDAPGSPLGNRAQRVLEKLPG